jgi:hypothetical protein
MPATRVDYPMVTNKWGWGKMIEPDFSAFPRRGVVETAAKVNLSGSPLAAS